jgi:hypothetical protein
MQIAASELIPGVRRTIGIAGVRWRMGILEFITSAGGLLSGAGTLLLGVAALWALMPRSSKGRMRRLLWPAVLFAGGACLAVAGAVVARSGSRSSAEKPAIEERTSQAWAAFGKQEYQTAVAYASRCIVDFQGDADREQTRLVQSGAPEPPTGKVSDQEKQVIVARGLLNDVATCFFIKGRSLEALDRKADAIAAYEAASKYTYARCWDPKGVFWAPATAALDRLPGLK